MLYFICTEGKRTWHILLILLLLLPSLKWPHLIHHLPLPSWFLHQLPTFTTCSQRHKSVNNLPTVLRSSVWVGIEPATCRLLVRRCTHSFTITTYVLLKLPPPLLLIIIIGNLWSAQYWQSQWNQRCQQWPGWKHSCDCNKVVKYSITSAELRADPSVTWQSACGWLCPKNRW